MALSDQIDKIRKWARARIKGTKAERDKRIEAARADAAAAQHRVIPRAEWGARAPKARDALTGTSAGVFIHHSVTAAPASAAAEEAALRGIQNYHMDTQGWNDIGYSFVVAPSGRIYEARGKGQAGAHTQGYNSSSYGLCVLGNYENIQPSAAALASLRWLRRTYLGLGNAPCRAHGAVNQTSCPGKNLRSQIGSL